VEAIKNPLIEHSPGDIPTFLKQKGVNVILAYDVGRRARAFFDSLGIEVIIGVQGNVREVVREYLKGSLSSDESWMELEEFRHRHGW